MRPALRTPYLIEFILAPTLCAAAILIALWQGTNNAALGALAVIVGLSMLPHPVMPDDAPKERQTGNWLPIWLAFLHFLLLACTCFAISNLSLVAGLLVLLCLGLFVGQVSHPVAHELIHRTDKVSFNLGKYIYVSLLFGHHTSAHRLVHHRFVATDKDPNSAPRGMSFYTFAPRAWLGSLKAGLLAEESRAWAQGLTYLVGTFLFTLLAFVIGGLWGGLAFLFVAAHGQMQILMSDYVQHYGLRRARIDDGYAPTGPEHSWDAPHLVPALMMLNAPSHAMHHLSAQRSFLENAPHPEAPKLPYPMAIMGFVALFPNWWRHVVDPRLPVQP